MYIFTLPAWGPLTQQRRFLFLIVAHVGVVVIGRSTPLQVVLDIPADCDDRPH